MSRRRMRTPRFAVLSCCLLVSPVTTSFEKEAEHCEADGETANVFWEAEAVPEGGLLAHASPAPRLQRTPPHDLTGGLYIDDKFCVGLHGPRVDALQRRMDSASEARGLPAEADKTQLATQEALRVLGLELRGGGGLGRGATTRGLLLRHCACIT